MTTKSNVPVLWLVAVVLLALASSAPTSTGFATLPDCPHLYDAAGHEDAVDTLCEAPQKVLDAGHDGLYDAGMHLPAGVVEARAEPGWRKVLRGAAGQGYRSFSAFKRAQGRAGDGLHWHHIVEQTPGNVSRFGPETIHSTQNLMRLDAATHRQISAYYSRIQPFTEGQTVRQWLSTQPLSAQREFGLQVLRDFGVAP